MSAPAQPAFGGVNEAGSLLNVCRTGAAFKVAAASSIVAGQEAVLTCQGLPSSVVRVLLVRNGVLHLAIVFKTEAERQAMAVDRVTAVGGATRRVA